MDTIHKLFLPSAIVSIIVGILLPNFRPIGIPLGIAFLVAGYILEKVFFRGKTYRLADLSERTAIDGAICGLNTSLLVSSKWDLDQSAKFSQLNGDYKISISEKYKDDFSLISKVSIEKVKNQTGEVKTDSIRVDVDTGWMLFLLAAEVDFFSPAKLERLIQGELKRLPNSKPLCLWLKNDDGQDVGVVVSSGEGDGTYSIKHQTQGGVLTKIEATFIGR